ncbi:Coiled-coil domain-containing protein [Helicobacter cetorum]|uniref:Coiled-coil domain-containing protein n=1 Tax=Helicobacter cetorum TaxID=138563 RepID=UPI000CF01509|nr:Coiled-coil domain-containing protein [Helicobacter cetorum]
MQDLQNKEQELKALQNELAQAQDSLENNFAKHMAEITDEKLEDLFFSNKEEFYKAVLIEQNNFIEETIGKTYDKAVALNDEIHSTKSKLELENAQKAFLEKNPDANMQEIIAFYNDELPPKYKRELDSLEDALGFFESLYSLYKTFKGEKEEEKAEVEEELPKQVVGNPSSNDAFSSGSNSVMERF